MVLRRGHALDLSILLLGSLIGVSRLAAGEVMVFAAASLSDALHDLAAMHEKATGDTVRLNLGASSTLARQIEEGAPAGEARSISSPPATLPTTF
jgi:molybdate transport system substrate-binding protein